MPARFRWLGAFVSACVLSLIAFCILGAACSAPHALAGEPAPAVADPKPAAEAPPEEEEEEPDPRVCVERGDDAIGLVRTARRAQDVGNWRLAIEKYSAALALLDEQRRRGLQPVFARESLFFVPLQESIEAELNSLPEEGREVLHLLRSAEAADSLARARASRSRAALERVAEVYVGLPAVPEALYLLGERAHAEGRDVLALAYWQRVLSAYPEWEGISRTKLLARAALVAAQSGRQGAAQELLGQIERTSGLMKVRVGAGEGLAAEYVAKRLKAAGRSAPEVGPARSQELWSSMAGGPSHAGAAPAYLDAGACRWSMTPFKPVAPAATAANASKDGPLRHAVCSGRTVFLAGDDGAVALSAETGREIWRADAAANGGPPATPATPAAAMPPPSTNLPALGAGRVYAVIGQTGLSAFDAATGRKLWRAWGGEGNAEAGTAAEFLKSVDLLPMPVYHEGRVYCPAVKPGRLQEVHLACFDASSGRLLWWTFVCAAQGFAFMERCLPPAVGDGLVALVTNSGGVAAIDAETGRVLWIRLYERMSHPPAPRKKKSRPVKLPFWAPSAPVISGGRLYAAPQDRQELVAFDLADGRTIWSVPRESMLQFLGVADGRAICTGVSEAAAWSAADGRGLWRTTLGVEVAGLGLLAGGSAILPTKTGLVRLDAESGRQRASYLYKRPDAGACNLALCGDVLVASGAATVGGYYQWDRLMAVLDERIAARPDAAAPRAELGAVYLSEGLLDESMTRFREAAERVKPWETVDGLPLAAFVRNNLRDIYHRIAKDSRGGWKRIVKVLDRDVSRNPDRAGPRVELGELYFWAGKYEDAVPVFLEALEHAAPGERLDDRLLVAAVKDRIWTCLLKTGRIAETPGDSDLRTFAEASKLRTLSGEDPFEFLRFARCRQTLEDWSAAVADYQCLVELFPGPVLTAGQGDPSRGHAGLFAEERIGEILARKGRRPYSRFDDAAAALLKRAREAGDLDAAEALVRRYPNSRDLPDAFLLLAAAARSGGRFKEEAALLREHLWRCPGAESETEARVRLALAYRAQGLEPLCAGILGRMAREDPGRKFDLDGRRWSLREFAAVHLPGMALSATGAAKAALRSAPGDLALPAKVVWKAEGLASPGNSISLVRLSDDCPEPAAVYVNSDNRAVAAMDAATGKPLWRSPLPEYVSDAMVTPRVVLALGSNKVRALSRQDGRQVWEFTLPFYAYARTEVCRVLLAYGDGVICAVGDGHALAIDEGSGLEIWSALFDGDYCSQAAMAGGLLLASTRNREDGSGSLSAYDLAGGTRCYRVELSPGFGNSVFRVCGGSVLAFKGGAIDCWSLASGKHRWRAFGEDKSTVTPLAVDDSRLVALAQSSGDAGPRIRLAAWDVERGKPLWSVGPLERQYPGPWLEPAGTAGWVAFASPDSRGAENRLLVFDGRSGLRTAAPELAGSAQPVATAGQVLAVVEGGEGAGSGGELRVWEPEGGRLLGALKCAPGSRLAVLGSRVFLVGSDGRLELLRAAK